MSDRDKEFRRDESIHRGSYLTGHDARPVEESKKRKKKEESDISESGMPEIMKELKRLTGFDPEELQDEESES